MTAGQLHLHTNQLKIGAFVHICEVGHTVQSFDSISGVLVELKMRLQTLGVVLERIVEDRRATGLAHNRLEMIVRQVSKESSAWAQCTQAIAEAASRYTHVSKRPARMHQVLLVK